MEIVSKAEMLAQIFMYHYLKRKNFDMVVDYILVVEEMQKKKRNTLFLLMYSHVSNVI